MMERPRLVLKTINGGDSESTLSFPQQIKSKLTAEVEVSADEDTEEISIFDAQRYFSEINSDARVSPLNMPNLDHNISISEPRFCSASTSATDHHGYGTYGRNYRVRSFHATPTVSSEASWNSQTGLLSNPPGAIAVSMSTIAVSDHDKIKGSGSANKFKWLWDRRCPCRGKKSVQVEPKTPLSVNHQKSLDTKILSWGDHKREDHRHHRFSADNNHQFHNSSLLGGQRMVASTVPTRPVRISADHVSAGTSSGFTFPILNQSSSSSHNSQIKIMGLAAVNINTSNDQILEDPPRESLEVFGPLDGASPISFPKKMASSRIITIDDDVASDTSSDLFEIESFSTSQSQSTSYPMYHRRDSLDEASNYINTTRRSVGYGGCPYSPMMSSECYEPSEASIEWSVTTAEGFERGSVGVSEAEEMMVAVHGNGGSNKKKSSGNGGGGLLSCRCEKAVNVGPNPVKYLPPHRLAPNSNTSKHVRNVNKPPLAR